MAGNLKWEKKNIVVGIYRHPNQTIANFYSSMEPVLNQISDKKLARILVGDINLI